MFRTVALPLARPAVALGLSLALLETLNDIGATEYLGVRTLTVSIYTTWINRGSLEGAAQIACVMLAWVAFILVLERRGRGARRFSASVKRPRVASPRRCRGRAWLAFASLPRAGPARLRLPVGFLLREAVIRTLRRASRRISGASCGDGDMAGCATVLVVGLGAWSWPPRQARAGRRSCRSARVASLGYAMPGTVLAVGLLWPLAAVDNALANAWRELTGSSARADAHGLGRGHGHRLRCPVPRHRGRAASRSGRAASPCTSTMRRARSADARRRTAARSTCRWCGRRWPRRRCSSSSTR